MKSLGTFNNFVMSAGTALLTLLSSAADAATHYIRDGGTASTAGTGACTGWAAANACDSFPTTLVRGDTYCVAAGSYASKTFNTANSGTTRTTIKRAVSGDGSCDQGANWVSSYGDGQAIFGPLEVTTGYWTIDGIRGGGPGITPAAADWNCANCGFVFRGESGIGVSSVGSPGNPHSIILRHLAIDGLDDGSGGPDRALRIWYANDLLIEYSYIHDAKCDLLSVGGLNNLTIQYSKLARPHQIVCHGDLMEWQAAGGSNIVFRWNFFEDIVGSYAFGTHDPTINGYEIYGNVFYWTPGIAGGIFFGNGLIGVLSATTGGLKGVKFYNNTLIGPISSNDGILGMMNLGSGGSGSAINNIWGKTSSGAGYNVGLGSTSSGNTCYNGNGSCNQNLSGSAPFSNYAGKNLTLTAATAAGTSLPSPYNIDMYGKVRGADGTWDRGAFEYTGSGSGSVLLSPPQNLKVN
jgi:hypothetical protein